MLSRSLVLGMAALGSSFTLPYRTPNDASVEVLEPVTTSTLSQRDIGYWCGCANDLQNDDAFYSTGGLGAAIYNGEPIPAGKSISSIRNTVVSFVCNLSDAVYNPNATHVAETHWPQIVDACGSDVAGTYQIQSGVYVGYMAYQPGLDFCGHALDSNVGDCCNIGSKRYDAYSECIQGCPAVSELSLQACKDLCVDHDADCAHPSNPETAQ